MTEIVKKCKISDYCIKVEESETQSVPQSNNSTKEPAVIKRNRYTFEKKQKILKESKNLTSQEICAKYGMSDSVLRKWKLNQDVIENAAKKSGTKTLKKVPKKDDLDAELFTWLTDCRRKGIPVSGPMLCRQALIINSRIGGSKDFKASHGWLDKWKKRTHIKNLKITGEKLSADEEAANPYKVKFAELAATKKPERAQIFNMDESGLMYKSTAKRTFLPGDRKQAPGGKKQLGRVTMAACYNADGCYVLPLILLEKSKHPRCLTNVNRN